MANSINHVYAIGDSFSFGQGLKAFVPDSAGFYPFNDGLRKTVYSGIIAEKLGIKNYTNAAMPGASNDRTIRKLFTDMSVMINEGIDPTTIFAIIGITHSARSEVYVPSSKIYRQIINNARPYNNDIKEYQEYWKLWVSYFDDPIEHVNRYLQQIISMQAFLEKYKIKYIMTNSMGESPEFLEISKKYQLPLSNLINRRTYPFMTSFNGWAMNQGFVPTSCNHANEEAHMGWADYLLEYINKEKLLE